MARNALGKTAALAGLSLLLGSVVARAYDTSWIITGQPLSSSKLKSDLDEAQARLSALENAGTSEIWVSDPPTSGSAFGSSSTAIFRFTNVIRSTGTAITRASTATDGDSYTINQAGVYSLYMTSPEGSGAGIDLGFSLNATGTDLTSDILVLDRAKRLGNTRSTGGTTRAYPTVSVTVHLSVGDVVRPHGGAGWVEAAAQAGAAPATMFHITKISN